MKKNIRKLLVLFAVFTLISAIYGCRGVKREIEVTADDDESNESYNESLFL